MLSTSSGHYLGAIGPAGQLGPPLCTVPWQSSLGSLPSLPLSLLPSNLFSFSHSFSFILPLSSGSLSSSVCVAPSLSLEVRDQFSSTN